MVIERQCRGSRGRTDKQLPTVEVEGIHWASDDCICEGPRWEARWIQLSDSKIGGNYVRGNNWLLHMPPGRDNQCDCQRPKGPIRPQCRASWRTRCRCVRRLRNVRNFAVPRWHRNAKIRFQDQSVLDKAMSHQSIFRVSTDLRVANIQSNFCGNCLRQRSTAVPHAAKGPSPDSRIVPSGGCPTLLAASGSFP